MNKRCTMYIILTQSKVTSFTELTNNSADKKIHINSNIAMVCTQKSNSTEVHILFVSKSLKIKYLF